jgi:uncharacterized protein (TIGR00299 family) protein
MSKLLYLDCFSGISGDMVLGALIDAGLPFDALKGALGSLPVPDVEVGIERVLRAGVSATRFVVTGEAHDDSEQAHATTAAGVGVAHAHDHGHAHADSHQHAHEHGDPAHVHVHATSHTHATSTTHADDHESGHVHHAHRSLPEIFRLIEQSALSPSGRDRAKALFQRLAEAEAAIHAMPVERVHLHEVGALDSIIDIVGAVFALEWFAADRIVCSPLNVGSGMVRSAHGVFPVPAPATVRLLGDAPIYSGSVRQELVTPTGALIVSSYADAFGAIPPMQVDQVGYGAGTRDNPVTPNVLRVLIGRSSDSASGDRVVVLECEIDDMNPQLFGVVMDRLYEAGALEVFYVPVQMKKNRPGTLLTIVVPPSRRAAMADIVFAETTTIGLRYREMERECLPREIVGVDTPLGPVRFKIAWRSGHIVNAAPEFDDCSKIAALRHLPVKAVQAAAVEAFTAAQRAGAIQSTRGR